MTKRTRLQPARASDAQQGDNSKRAGARKPKAAVGRKASGGERPSPSLPSRETIARVLR
jgi:hypothetical protein